MELNQRSINEGIHSEIFDVPSVLSCRKSFYELNLSESTIQQQYTEKIELLPLEFTEPVKEYIVTFCNNMGDKKYTVSNRIIGTIQKNKELLDLAKNPLLLTMILDVLSEPNEIPKIKWSRSKLYEVYTEKWLKNEADKPDSKLRWDEKADLMEEIAWSIYQKSIPSSHAYDDEFYQSVKFTKTEVESVLIEPCSLRFQHIPFVQIIDDICHRSFLIGGYGGYYYFTHKSFQEYYVAKHIINCMQKSAKELARTLKESTPAEIAHFLEDMLGERAKRKYESDLIVNNLIEAYKQNVGDRRPCLIIREHSCYYLACLGTQKATQFLEQSYQSEANKWVQRGMMVGLGIFCNREDIIEKYIHILYIDPEAASINIGYNLAYCGDQSLEEALEGGYCDTGKSKCEGLIRGIFRHLNSEKHEAGWALDLFILRTLLQDKRRGISILNANYEYIQFLNEFLCNDHREHGTIFYNEKKLLQELLASASDEENNRVLAIPRIRINENQS